MLELQEKSRDALCMLVRSSTRQRARNLRRMAKQDPDEVLMLAIVAAGGNISPNIADKLAEEGIVSTKKMIIFDKNRRGQK